MELCPSLLFQSVQFSSVQLLSCVQLFAVLWTAASQASLVPQRVKHLLKMQETWVRSLGQEDSLEKEMATHSSVLAWRIPRMLEPGGLPSLGSHRIRHDWSNLGASAAYYSWGSQGKNTGMVCHSLLQWTTFCQNSPPWPVCLGWPYTAWLTVSLS